MHWAAPKASDKMADTLIKNGVKDVSLQDHTFHTPLHYAAKTGNSKFIEVIKHFLIFGNGVAPQLNVVVLLLAVGICFITF